MIETKIDYCRCLCCGLDFRDSRKMIAHHDNNRALCRTEREKREKRLKGYLPSMPAVVVLLRECGVSTTDIEKINDANPVWLRSLTKAPMAYSLKVKRIVHAAKDPRFAMRITSKEFEDALDVIEMMAEQMGEDEDKEGAVLAFIEGQLTGVQA